MLHQAEIVSFNKNEKFEYYYQKLRGSLKECCSTNSICKNNKCKFSQYEIIYGNF